MPFLNSITDRSDPLFKAAAEYLADLQRTTRAQTNGSQRVVTKVEIERKLHQWLNDGKVIQTRSNDAQSEFTNVEIDGKNAPAILSEIAATSSEFEQIFESSGC